MSPFLATQPSTEDYWRGIILLGRNVATYKLALAKSLLEFSAAGKSFVTMEELAVPYTRHLTEHLRQTEKQITSKSSKFLDACLQFNQGKLNQTGLVDSAVRLGFNNVIDAFHVVNQGPIPERFFVDDRKSRNGITLTDTLLTLATSNQASNLPIEVEARWRLVETAWSLALPPQLLALQYDAELESLFINIPSARINVTGCRDALNGYQKGRCFYCFGEILIDRRVESDVDVDHFFPITLSQYSEFMGLNLNGVWNLVLSCSACNRGVGGKSARVPTTRLLERLHTRNQFYIESNHPLRETLINQTGTSEPVRRNYLQQVHRDATTRLLHTWESPYEHPSVY
jgi:5-methylcytosine-specific restriction endonuclease McrA